MKILIVEDNRMDIDICRNIFGRLFSTNDSIEFVETADAMINMFNHGDPSSWPDIIFLDIYLPGKMNGIQALQEIKSNLRSSNFKSSEYIDGIPVVIMSTSVSDQNIVSAFDFQADFYIEKPIQEKHVKKIFEALSAKGALT